MTNQEALQQVRDALESVRNSYRTYSKISTSQLECEIKPAISTLDRLIAGAPDGWMPIETAPKDGTTILVWHKDYEYGAGVSLWSDTYDKFMVGNNRPQPTLWHPLPAAPKHGGE